MSELQIAWALVILALAIGLGCLRSVVRDLRTWRDIRRGRRFLKRNHLL